MRALIMSYSVTGTVRRVGERIADGLRSAGVDVVTHDLRDGRLPAVDGFDVVGIGSPVHYFRLAAPAVDALRSFSSLDGRSAFIFVVHGTYRGFALNEARRKLRRLGAAEIGVFTCYGDDRFLGYTRRGYEFSPDHPTPEELSAAEEFGRALPEAHAAVQAGSPLALRPADPWPGLVYAIEHVVLSPWLVRAVYGRIMRADASRCTKCGRCAHVCPAHNITWEKGERPTWGRTCVGCFACAETCPEEAVRTALDWPLFRPFLAYNVRHAARDPAIDRARVEMRRGRIVRLQEGGTAQKGEHHED